MQGTAPAAAFKIGNRVALKNYTFGYDGNFVSVAINQAPLWTGSGPDNNWSTTANWTTPPTTGQTVAFNSTTPRMLVNNDAANAGASYAGISFGPAPGSYTLTGQGLTMTADIINFSPSLQTIDLPLTIDPNSMGIALNAQAGPIVTTANGTINNGGVALTVNGSSSVTLNGVVSGSGDLTKIGGSALLLAASNAYTGNTNINAGTVQVSNDYNLGNGGAVNFNGGTLRTVATGIASSRTVNLNAGNGTFDTNGLNSTLAGPIAGVGSLTKIGNGVLSITNSSTTAPNSYTGGTIVSGGTLALGNNTTGLGTGSVTLSGGVLSLNPAGSAGLAAVYYNNITTQITSASLANFNSTYGGLTVGLKDNITADIGTSGVFSFDTGGEGSKFPSPYNLTGALQVNNWASEYSGYFYATTNGTYTFGTISDDNSRLWIDNADTAVVVNGTAAGGQGEAGTPTTGSVYLTAGYHPITVAYDEGTGGFGLQVYYTPPSGVQTLMPLSLLSTEVPLYNNALNVTAESAIDLGSASIAALFPSLSIGDTTLHITGGSAGAGSTITGATMLTGNVGSTFDVQGVNTLTLQGAVSGSSGFTKIGAGTLALTGTGNNYTGGSMLTAGLVQVNNPASLGDPSSPVTLNGGNARGHRRLCRRPSVHAECRRCGDSSRHRHAHAERGCRRQRRTGQVGQRRTDARPGQQLQWRRVGCVRHSHRRRSRRPAHGQRGDQRRGDSRRHPRPRRPKPCDQGS